MKIDLKLVETEFLVRLRNDISVELNKRQILPVPTSKSTLTSIRQYANIGALDPEIEKVNSDYLFSLPIHNGADYFSLRRYLPSLLAQDWEYLFESYENESKNFYVYAHMDKIFQNWACSDLNILPGEGAPFYIGKGTGLRAYDLKRNQGHGKALNKLKEKGYLQEDIVKINFDGLSERAAMAAEAKLIYFFGTIYEADRKGILLNLDLSKRPDFVGMMHHFKTKKIKDHIAAVVARSK